jgi:hypothetical protein
MVISQQEYATAESSQIPGPTQSPDKLVGAPFLGLNRPEYETDNSSSVGVQNAYSFILTASISSAYTRQQLPIT